MYWHRGAFSRPVARRAPARDLGTSSRAYEPVVPQGDLDEESVRDPYAAREAAPFVDVPDPGAPTAPLEAASVDAELEDLRAAKVRVERDRDRVLAETRATVVREMLPVLDNLDRSLAA